MVFLRLILSPILIVGPRGVFLFPAFGNFEVRPRQKMTLTFRRRFLAFWRRLNLRPPYENFPLSAACSRAPWTGRARPTMRGGWGTRPSLMLGSFSTGERGGDHGIMHPLLLLYY